MVRLDYFNRLPAREEHLSLVQNLMKGGGKFQLKSIISRTGLSRTQVLCTLQALIDSNSVVSESVGKVKFYSLTNCHA